MQPEKMYDNNKSLLNESNDSIEHELNDGNQLIKTANFRVNKSSNENINGIVLFYNSQVNSKQQQQQVADNKVHPSKSLHSKLSTYL